MKLLLTTALTIAALSIASIPTAPPTAAGSCDYSWQKAKDGSSCGNRAANRRAGGK